MIEVQESEEGYSVHVKDERSESFHYVTLSDATFEKYGKGRTKKKFVEACFEFLLDRESKESILKEFDIEVIRNYFPDFETKI